MCGLADALGVLLGEGDGAVLAASDDHQLGAEVKPCACGVVEGAVGVEPLQVLVGCLHDAGEGHELFSPSAALVNVVDEGGAAVRVVAEQGAVAGCFEGCCDHVRAGFEHGGDGAGVHCVGGACQFGELLSDGVEGPGDVEFVLCRAVGTDGCMGDGGAFSTVFEGQGHLGCFQVCVNALAVGVGAVVADEVGGVAEAACADGYVHGRSARVGAGFSVVLVDDVYECFTDYSQHGFNSTHVFRVVTCVFVGI